MVISPSGVVALPGISEQLLWCLGGFLSKGVFVAAAPTSWKGLSPLVATAEEHVWLVSNKHRKGEKILENSPVDLDPGLSQSYQAHG